MDLNDIQNAWNNEKTENVVLPDNLEKIQSANTPLDKIRKNLKNEFYYQIISIIIIGFAPIFYQFPDRISMFFYLIFSMFTAVCVYYLAKLYFFHKRLNNITLKTKDSLYETYFDIKLNMELYKTFGFALTPFVVLGLIGFQYYVLTKSSDFQINQISNSQLIGFIVLVFFSIICMGLALEWWVHRFYGKYAKEIRKVIDELKEE
ncbi:MULTISPECIES: hypothetical protein [Flavobacterium]|uniref:DUF3278 domain-containing protein n=1 Tax=Flavobacterium salmonis TaxID=2654844 RepID=A0A6V6YP32_9FLAO|nr:MULTISPECIES: hypothetical protein [Flavobacterium]OOV16884.1 hypothetical protein BXU10_18125 [Flavobacterium sp. LM4]CAD0001205.1 hypothetical protein FLAT13_00436 [Flavobacterium salmonis]